MAREKPKCKCFYCGEGDYVKRTLHHSKRFMVDSTIEVDTHLLFGNAAHAHCHEQAMGWNKSKYATLAIGESDTNAFKRVARWAAINKPVMAVYNQAGEKQ